MGSSSSLSRWGSVKRNPSNQATSAQQQNSFSSSCIQNINNSGAYALNYERKPGKQSVEFVLEAFAVTANEPTAVIVSRFWHIYGAGP
ncbi:hypothetical protein DPMN_003710 [Dreissena polymorpha]|uniref:Uncharacterized protein n=1 Tax=Dreissena polymorpha TaxID=45954 RepID=A0A9D4MQ78_DREPO|nr:hypothetical protein DPMN_003710 [Dreissena polymorpha]